MLIPMDVSMFLDAEFNCPFLISLLSSCQSKHFNTLRNWHISPAPPRSPECVALEAIFFEALSESVPPSPQVPNNFPTS
jgi:hypothetical protein